MKIKLERANVFTAKNLEGLGELRLVSQWEGFSKLQCDQGFLIVMDERSQIAKSLDSAFDQNEAEYCVITATPDIAAIMQSTAND